MVKIIQKMAKKVFFNFLPIYAYGRKTAENGHFRRKNFGKKIQLPQFLFEPPQNLINSSTVVGDELIKFGNGSNKN